MRASMNISLPAHLKKWVDDQVEQRGYSTASEYVRDVLRREQEQLTRRLMDDRLVEAIDSGESKSVTRDTWRRIRRAGLKQARGRKKQ